jgi:hypothetical protein
MLLHSIERPCLTELTVWNLGDSFFPSSQPNQSLDLRIPRGEIRIANGPVTTRTVNKIRIEIKITPPVRLPGPGGRTPPELISTNPPKRRIWITQIRMLSIIHKIMGQVRPFEKVTVPLDMKIIKVDTWK